MTTKKTKINLYQKLVEVRKSVPYLQKDNEGFNFKYVSYSQALSSARTALDEQGIMIVPSVESFDIRDHTTKSGGHEYFTVLNITYTVVNADDPVEILEIKWMGQGLDSGEKGVGKALTYAEKYLFLKLFNIPTDKDDPDSFQRRSEPQVPMMSKNQSGLIWSLYTEKFPGLTSEQTGRGIKELGASLDCPNDSSEWTSKNAAAVIGELEGME